jgi:hypothetical protein
MVSNESTFAGGVAPEGVIGIVWSGFLRAFAAKHGPCETEGLGGSSSGCRPAVAVLPVVIIRRTIAPISAHGVVSVTGGRINLSRTNEASKSLLYAVHRVMSTMSRDS